MSRSPLPRRALAAGTIVLGTLTVIGCSDDGNTAGAFCQRLSESATELTAPIATPGDVERTVELYRSLGQDAPLAIDEEWQQLVRNVETAATVDPDDPESVQRAVDSAYASEEPAHAVATWAESTCAVTLAPVGTVAPPPPSTTTTVDD